MASIRKRKEQEVQVVPNIKCEFIDCKLNFGNEERLAYTQLTRLMLNTKRKNESTPQEYLQQMRRLTDHYIVMNNKAIVKELVKHLGPTTSEWLSKNSSTKLNFIVDKTCSTLNTDKGCKIVILSKYTRFLILLNRQLSKKLGPNSLSILFESKDPLSIREKSLERFKSDPMCRILLTSTDVLKNNKDDLSAANVLILPECSYDYDEIKMYASMLYHTGQKRDVTVYRTLVQGSMDSYEDDAAQRRLLNNE